MDKLQLDLPLLLPAMEAGDACVHLLTDTLATTRGVDAAHITRSNGTARLCLHFDPNLVSLGKLERVAQEAGASITGRYRHETLPFSGLDAADVAESLAASLQQLPGMLHADVNYAAGLIFVAYDSEALTRVRIGETIRQMGAMLTPPAPRAESAPPAHEAGHAHGSAPVFLPHWMQERWTLILVTLAGLFLLIGWAGATFFAMPQRVALVFYVLAYLAGGYDVATHAVPGLLRGRFDTDVLMLAAAIGAAILGAWAEGAFLLFLFSLGHAGEHYALDRARNAVNALGELMPSRARVRRGDAIEEIDVAAVQVGDVVVVRPGDRIPVDGTVRQGASAVDQSPITGESVPVEKTPGDEVFAGTVNQDAALDIETTRLAADNTLSRVLQLVEEAQSQQSPTQQFTQRFTRWFVPAILVTVLAVIALPPLLGWMPLDQSFYRAMLLLVAASPCALAIGTPAAVLAGIAQAARNGVLIKGGVHLENLGRLQVMAFDKTGTLTRGKFQVADIVTFGDVSEEHLLQVAAAVEQHSNHPLALAVVDAARAHRLDLPQADGLENVPGRGVRSTVDGQPMLIGSLKLFAASGADAVPSDVTAAVARLEGEGKTTMTVSQGGVFLGVLALADQPRPAVQETLQQLLDLGIRKLVMLTGDNAQVAERIAAEIGVTDVRAGLLPEHKLEAIQALEREHGAIAMTGDGVNDAPALATATVGIAMGGAGTAVALETADVALMADDLGRLPFAVGLSRAARAIIRQNLVISLGVIVLLILTSVLGWVQLTGAVILHEGSTIVVVLNALRLLNFKARSGAPKECRSHHYPPGLISVHLFTLRKETHRMINAAVIGYGYAGRSFHSYLIGLAEGLHLYAIATRDEERQRAAAAEHPGAKIYAGIGEALGDEQVDLVVIATPHDTHKELSVRAMDAGKHVVSDKIMAMNAAEAAQMIAASRRNGVMLSVFQNRRWDGDFLTLQRVLAEGWLGDPYLFQAAIMGYRKPRGWRAQAQTSGGILFDWPAHFVDQALQLVPADVTQVYCTILHQDAWQIDIGSYAKLLLTFANGVLYEIEIGNLAGVPKPRWYVLGDMGGLVKWGLDPQEDAMRAGHIETAHEDPNLRATVWSVRDGEPQEFAVEGVPGAWTSYYDNIADVLLRGAELTVKPEQALQAMRVFDAAMQSARTGQPAALAPEPEIMP